jgi:CheY-like chemotaxis protein/phosphoribosyl 1,2-cyclic phosphodiesterase
MRAVLIIDDDAAFRSLVADLLKENWRVLQAADGVEGLELAKAQRPEVILCDLLMAPLNGFQVCRRLRELPALNDTQIVVTSGRDFEADRRSALEAGADDYLTKPLSALQLMETLARCREIPPHPVLSPGERGAVMGPGLKLRFWGVRGSIATPGATTLKYGGNTSCIEVRAGEQIIILDAGTGLRLLGRSLINEFRDRPLELVLLLTHTHWDHIQGLPFFLPVYKPQNRLRILGYEGARNGLHAVLNSQMETPFFPIGLGDVPGNISIEELTELSFNLGPVQVQAAFANHPGICVGYRLSLSGQSIAFFPDNELRHSANVQQGKPLPASIEFARQENSKLAQFIRGTDVLIMDTQYDSLEYRQHIGWGHGCMEEVVLLSLEAGIKKLFLFHHDPDHDDSKISQMVAEGRQMVASRGGSLEVDAAREGLTVELAAMAPSAA